MAFIKHNLNVVPNVYLMTKNDAKQMTTKVQRVEVSFSEFCLSNIINLDFIIGQLAYRIMQAFTHQQCHTFS